MKRNNFLYVFITVLIIVILFLLVDFYFFNKYQKYASYKDFITRDIAVSREHDIKVFFEEFMFRSSPPTSNTGKNKQKSVVFLGCSFVYGLGLKENETFPWQFSKYVDMPVYNLGMCSAGLNHTLFILESHIFDETIKIKPSVVVYNHAFFLTRRLFMTCNPEQFNEFLYKVKDNKLIRRRPPFIISRFILLKLIRENIYQYLYKNSRLFGKYISKVLLLHFKAVKNQIDGRYDDVKYIILKYGEDDLFEEIAADLEDEGFIIIRTNEDLGVDVLQEEFRQADGHPSAYAWEVITPKFIEKIKPYLQ